MPEFLIFEPRHPEFGGHRLDPGPRRGFVAAAGRFVRAVPNILGCLAVAGGLALGGYKIAASSSDTLTSGDPALVQLIAADQAAHAVDPFATRSTPRDSTPEDDLYGKRLDALLGYSFGLTMALLSLAAFAGCWFLTGNALGFYRRVY